MNSKILTSIPLTLYAGEHESESGSTEYGGIVYLVERPVGKLKKDLSAKTKIIKAHSFGRPEDFKWIGCSIAESLNNDSELRNLLYGRLASKQEGKIKIYPGNPKVDRYGRIRAGRGNAFTVEIHVAKAEKCRAVTNQLSSVFPSEEDFQVYDRIAKHIKEYKPS